MVHSWKTKAPFTEGSYGGKLLHKVPWKLSNSSMFRVCGPLPFIVADHRGQFVADCSPRSVTFNSSIESSYGRFGRELDVTMSTSARSRSSRRSAPHCVEVGGWHSFSCKGPEVTLRLYVLARQNLDGTCVL